jgi:hypothetical protein
MAKATNVLPDLAARTSDMVDEVIPTMRGTRADRAVRNG